MLRRVLILTYDFPPRGATGVFRVTKFARYLPDFGWQPVVVTATVRGGMRDEALLAQLPPDLDVIRVDNPFAPPSAEIRAHNEQPSVRPRLRQGLRRWFIPDPQILWVPAAVHAASRQIDRGDIKALMTTAPPFSVHIAGLWLKRRFPHLPWLMDLRDIWSENPAISDPRIYKLQRACERVCLRHADQIITATDGQRRLLEAALGVPDARITTITNGFDPADFPAIDPSPPQPNAPLRLTYLGSLIGTRAAATRGLFDTLNQLVADGISAADLQVRLVGIFDPAIYARVEPLVAQGIVRIAPFTPYAGAIAEMTAADVLLLITSNDREGRLSQPNKLFEYFAVGKPILALTPEGDNARLVREAQAGVALPPDAVDQIAATLRSMIKAHLAGSLAAVDADNAHLLRFQRRELTRELAAQLDRLAG